ncbi:MAG: PQQ-binding-like beta-propeller repeat protein [Myxococcales bacterium]|nr:PQQ-binding-like beta-propeller repeat protein [Myxococcales bacterium]
MAAAVLGALAALASGCDGRERLRRQDPALAEPPAQAKAPTDADRPAGPVAPPPADTPDPEDALGTAREANGPHYGPPDAGFRAGFARPSAERPKRLASSARRFDLQLPTAEPVATPAVHRGLVVTGSGRWVGAVKEQKGDFVWAVESDDPGPSSVACEDDTCVWNTESCTLVAASASTGAVRWGEWIGSVLLSAPTVASGRVYAAFAADAGNGLRPSTATHGLAAFDLLTGRTLWKRWIDREVIGAPVAKGDALYAATYGGTLYVVDQPSGALRSAKARQATSPPVVDEAGVHYARKLDGGREGLAFEPVSPGESAGLLASGPDAPAPLGGRSVVVHVKPADYLDRAAPWLGGGGIEPGELYGVTAPGVPVPAWAGQQAFQGARVVRHEGRSISVMGDELVCIEANQVRWSLPLSRAGDPKGGILAAAPALAGGRVVLAKASGEVLVVAPGSGEVLARHNVGHPIMSEPAVMDGWLYVGTADGWLVGIDTGDPTLTGWSAAGGGAARNGA